MKADFQGWATTYGVECTDGKTIMHGAFEGQDKAKVPLVWQHGHGDPEMVLGHAVLESREEGIYAYAYFNETPKAQHAKSMVQHRDVSSLSIWANQLVQKANQVFHGVVREVSLVLAGANPGAVIESVTIQHADGGFTIAEDEVIIHSGIEFDVVHSDEEVADEEAEEVAEEAPVEEAPAEEAPAEEVEESTEEAEEDSEELEHADDDLTVEEVYKTLTEDQKTVVHYLISEALSAAAEGDIKQDTMNLSEEEGTDEMKHNLFEQNEGEAQADDTVLSHSQIEEIMGLATRSNMSLRSAANQYGVQHGITNIELMFPDAQATSSVPEWHTRRMEWVSSLMGATKKQPFSRIKTLFADITESEARARGYIKGNLKKEEFFSVSKRVTTPQTVYKKQKLDRDDIIDITDFDVVNWLKGEMRLMLDEEIARAILVGDGRDVASEDKISETNIRPIATDHDLYSVKVRVQLNDALSSAQEIIDAVILNRHQYKGTGSPLFFASETVIATFLVLKDGFDRPMYKDLSEVASALRVSRIVPCEVLEDHPGIAGIMVNPVDYSVGTDQGGQVTMFDDFDIDYNQNKYLIETRLSGALTKLKSAIVVELVDSGIVLVSPAAPTFDAVAGEITIVDTTGVIYKRQDTDAVVNAAGSPISVASGDSLTIYAEADTGYALEDSEDNEWTFTAD